MSFARDHRLYSEDLMAPFESSENPFFGWYRAAAAAVPVLRNVFTGQDQPYVDEILRRHLNDDSLGTNYREDSIVLRADREHMELAADALIQQEVGSILDALHRRGGASGPTRNETTR